MRNILILLSFSAAVSCSDESIAADTLPADRPIHEVIDHYVDAKLRGKGVEPAPQANDANILRRTMLDLVGRVPTTDEAREYIESTDPNKRHQLVDRLIGSPSFNRHQATEFDTMLMYGSGKSMRDYLLNAFESRRSWDRMFRDMLLGEDRNEDEKGANQFVKSRISDLDKLTNSASVAFFGINVSCAKCHDHPEVPDWKQAHFFGMKSFFSRTFAAGDYLGETDRGIVKYQTTTGESLDAKLMFLTGTVIDEPPSKELTDEEKKKEKKRLDELKKKKQPPPKPKFSRRSKLVEVALQDGENKLLAKSIVNRVWHRLLGNGLVSPVDQMHPENPASHPKLLQWLARDLIAHKYDLRRLIRGIVLSRTYSRSSEWKGGEYPVASLFAVGVVRPLSPAQYGTLLRMASTNPDTMSASMNVNEFEKKLEGIENAGRGLGGVFEQPVDDFQISVSEALLFSNGDRISRELLRDSRDSLVGKLKEMEDDVEAIETAIWAVHGRPPQDGEVKVFQDYLKRHEARDTVAWQQVVWAMLSSSESRFNY